MEIRNGPGNCTFDRWSRSYAYSGRVEHLSSHSAPLSRADSFFREDCIGLFDSIVRNLPELSVQFNGVPVKENLVLLKGLFMNDGHKDISLAMVEQRLRAVLPEGYRWLTAKVVLSSPEVKASAQITSDTNLEFDLGLFRCGEILKFEALAEVPTGDTTKDWPPPSFRLERSLSFEHRIADTGNVKATSIPFDVDDEPDQARNKIKVLVVLAILALVGLIMFARYADQKKYNTIDATVQARDLEKLGIREITLAEFFEELWRDISGNLHTIGASIAFMASIVLAIMAFDLWKYLKFRKIRALIRNDSSLMPLKSGQERRPSDTT